MKVLGQVLLGMLTVLLIAGTVVGAVIYLLVFLAVAACGTEEGATQMIVVGVIVLAVLIGLITLCLYGFIRSLRPARPPQLELASQHGRLTRDDVALINYIRKAAAHGHSPAQIDERLRRSGWSDEALARARMLTKC